MATLWGNAKQDYPGGPIYRPGTSTDITIPEQPMQDADEFESETPRTDANRFTAVPSRNTQMPEVCDADFARGLEKELDEAKKRYEIELDASAELLARLVAAEREMDGLRKAIDPYHSRLVWNFSGGCYMSDLERKDLDALNAVLKGTGG